MFERFTEKAIKVIMLAQEEARRLGHNFVGTEQILLGLIGEGTGIAAKTLKSLGVTLRDARVEVEKIIGRGSGFVAVEIPFTPRAKRVLELSWDEARQLGHNYIGTEHLLLGLIREGEGVAVRVLENVGVELARVRSTVIRMLGETTTTTSSSTSARSKTPTLDEFGTNLTQQAEDNRLDPVIGREKEIQRVIEILGRRTKNNPVLIGEPGVGKTAIAEGLAQMITSGTVPDILTDKRVVMLDIGSLVAGTKYRGEFEERLKKIMEEIRNAGNIILVIDEMHTLIGAGAAEGAVDAANILKPALARGELQCIGATTLDEYRKHIERDAALERRFQPIMVDQPSVEDTISILWGLRDRYEAYHKLKISDEALVAAARLADRYISDRFLPDKAIDLMDEAASKVRLRNSLLPPEAKELEKELKEVSKKKEEAIRDQDFEGAGNLRDQEQSIRDQIREMTLEWKDKKGQTQQLVVDEDHIAEVVAGWTKIPVSKLTEGETERLLKMEDVLHERIIGQHEAVTAISKAIRRTRAGLKNPKRPIGAFIFSGPSGVGKTELAKVLSSFYFGSEDALIRVDMSEYMERHSVSKLIGSPPGYVGFQEGGQLTEMVRRKPYSVILFDEIEKAHPDTFNVLLQIMEDGRLSDSKGRVVDFKNTILIMTSNIGARAIEKGGGGLGFHTGGGSEEESRYERIRERVMDELKQNFRPEFLNRVTETIVFHPLKKEEIREIVDIMLVEVKERLKEADIQMTFDVSLKDMLGREGYDEKSGARPLRRTISKRIEDPLSEELLLGKIPLNTPLVLKSREDSSIYFEPDEPEETAEPEKEPVESAN
ncbi:ATP-dependent Clp protease ATP-binding subunit ClpC [bacterium (Candidatus Blackallbacteria) CG17_big_fil_post_rev_8_21_14_2_50_48_46]|uniref:ATP-dependent Clp protease ATP-binding subunit ClpC n=1 Tax=bacterium (Candidatus Blackallbacteria) CG17_big_fil_post_rev_8_21_14_2_50_48_46 TaxID=2014261 RepID=A0A2M7FWU5_9BACT|nr:MAG: ATP-dependent Clp protease ATP-binding subunit ClpC [bacterium (Candidatus Blackallbacteria) CG18_big_fil_WC_8_21_14_2_50_49_26]PIW13721.1 MAG: ATP-dependent Clp protease ATP-binding subunit ClpC [bacterium (Candidatus Blackallbacteria) CG17_big_fil_post_rev_8_21_14_2_50_48_46]PIW44947.1 MAG: ATP-dependent Clp protease ATP-binding subunit ClpC [bacterium (Candidatus Blackallbacteria) CG13_big_fil_rev_8_21_14_2_50_49_14]